MRLRWFEPNTCHAKPQFRPGASTGSDACPGAVRRTVHRACGPVVGQIRAGERPAAVIVSAPAIMSLRFSGRSPFGGCFPGRRLARGEPIILAELCTLASGADQLSAKPVGQRPGGERPGPSTPGGTKAPAMVSHAPNSLPIIRLCWLHGLFGCLRADSRSARRTEHPGALARGTDDDTVMIMAQAVKVTDPRVRRYSEVMARPGLGPAG